jgi:hypothetical protein
MEKQAPIERCARSRSTIFSALSVILLVPVPALALALDGTVTQFMNTTGDTSIGNTGNVWAAPSVSGNTISITPQDGTAGQNSALFEYRFGFTGAPGTANLNFIGWSNLNISSGTAVITWQIFNNGGNLGGVILATGQFSGSPSDNLGTTTPVSVPNNNYTLDVTIKFSKDSVWTWNSNSSTTHAFATLP